MNLSVDPKQTQRRFVFNFVAAVLISLTWTATSFAQNAKPNIVLIVADDLGYGDLAPETMPKASAIKALGSELRLISHQNCAPTRAALMTGLQPHRMNLATVWPTPIEPGIPENISILPEWLKGAGYRTGIFGKWHLGWQEKSQWPTRRGFDEFVGFLGGHIDSYGVDLSTPAEVTGHSHHGIHDLQWNETPLHTPAFSTHLFRDSAVRFIREHCRQDRRFFCYVPFNAPHGPFSAPAETVRMIHFEMGLDAEVLDGLASPRPNILAVPEVQTELYPEQVNLVYKAMVAELDDAVDKIYQSLVDEEVANNTVFIFMSDNGAVRVPAGANAPFPNAFTIGTNGHLRGGKGTGFEGGIRVANFVVSPSFPLNDVSENSNTTVWAGDLPVTLAKMARAELPSLVDGQDFRAPWNNDTSVFRRHGLDRVLPELRRRDFAAGRDATAPTAVKRVSATFVNGRRKYKIDVSFDSSDRVVKFDQELYNTFFDESETDDLVNDPLRAGWLQEGQGDFAAFGGLNLLNSIPQSTGFPVWRDFEFTDEFGFEQGTPVFKTEIITPSK